MMPKIYEVPGWKIIKAFMIREERERIALEREEKRIKNYYRRKKI